MVTAIPLKSIYFCKKVYNLPVQDVLRFALCSMPRSNERQRYYLVEIRHHLRRYKLTKKHFFLAVRREHFWSDRKFWGDWVRVQDAQTGPAKCHCTCFIIFPLLHSNLFFDRRSIGARNLTVSVYNQILGLGLLKCHVLWQEIKISFTAAIEAL